jgi:hypothetical protein
MDIRWLQDFQTAAEVGHFTRASDGYALYQPNTSRSRAADHSRVCDLLRPSDSEGLADDAFLNTISRHR